MIKFLQRFGLWLSLLVYGVPQVAQVAMTSAPIASVSVSAPLAFSAPALAGATAIVAALAEGAEAVTQHALNFDKSNTQSGSDIRLLWSGANLLPRNEHTAIWWYNPRQQTGYYAVAWHSPNTGSWDGGEYSWGTHPYPAADGSVDADGKRQTGTGSIGTVHFWEQAGLGIADDFLCTPGGAGGLQVVKNKWYVQVRKCRVVVGGPNDGLVEHIFIPDLLGNPSFVIQQWYYDQDNGSIPFPGTLPGPAGATPAFYFGASDWTASGSANEETPAGKIRGIQLYDAWLDAADVALEAANTSSNSPVTAAGIANVWYVNQDPIPTDVADKSGAGHNPTWANANRPVQWDSTFGSATPSFRGTLLGVGR